MNRSSNVVGCGILAFFIFQFSGFSLAGQSCFSINVAQSKIIMDQVGPKGLPDDGDTVLLPCTSRVMDFALVMQFNSNTEKYFEDTAQLVGTLTYKSLTLILQYDKSTNTFRLPNNQPNLSAGNYFFTITSAACLPSGAPCLNCMAMYSVQVVYQGNITVNVSIATAPDPPVLTCVPGSTVGLTGTLPPNLNFAAQWYKLVNTQFIKISGATTNTYTALQTGTYRYTLSGPAGCAGSATTTISAPEVPEVTITPAAQPLDACAQTITGVEVSNAGSGGSNLLFHWTVSNGGLIKTDGNTAKPVVSAPGTYTVQVSRKDNSCTATATVNVPAGTVPLVLVDVVYASNDKSLDCNTSVVPLTAAAHLSFGSSAFSYTWSDGSADQIDVKAPGSYSVTATSLSTGCQGTASATIDQDLSIPNGLVTTSRDTACMGDHVTLTVTPLEPVFYSWADNSNAVSYDTPPLQEGENTYAVTITAKDNGCTTSLYRSVYGVPLPVVTCSDYSLEVQNGVPLSIDCNSLGGQLIWAATQANVQGVLPSGKGAVQNQVFNLINGQAPGTVLYYFYGKNAGCTSDRAALLVTVLPNSEDGIFIPELITPNGDGMNDTWKIVLPDGVSNPEKYTLQLYNRYGSLVYSGNLATAFDANPYPDGTYYYVLTHPDGVQNRSAVTILRRQ